MSAISPEIVKQWVRDELKRILDAGLMYTESTTITVKVGDGTAITPTAVAKPDITLSPAPTAQTQLKTTITQPDIVKPLPELIWEQMPPPVSKPENGPWEKCVQIQNPALQEIINMCAAQHGFGNDDLYRYWLLTEQGHPENVKGVGRRAKA